MIILKKRSLLFQRKRNLSDRNWIFSCVVLWQSVEQVGLRHFQTLQDMLLFLEKGT